MMIRPRTGRRLYGILCHVLAGSLGAQAVSPHAPEAPVSPLTLGDAIRLAARASAVVQEAQSRAEQADARMRQTRSALLPTFNALGTNGARTFNSTSLGFTLPSAPGQPPLFAPTGQILGPVRSLDVRGSVMQSLVDPGALGRLRSARTLARASTTDVAATADQAGTVAALAYLRVLRAEAECRARTADSALAAALVSIAQHQQAANAGIALDVIRAQTQLASVHSLVIAARNTRDRARLELLHALNLPLSAPLRLQDSLDTLPVGDLSTDAPTAVRRALANRPDLRAADLRLAATRQSVSAIRAERLPTLRFVGDDGMNSNGHRGDLLHTYTYALELSIPIFDGALRQSRLQEQAAYVREAEVQDADLRGRVEVDVRTALLDLDSATEQVEAARATVHLADEQVVQARDRFRQGAAGNADVITALLTRTSAQTALLDALLDAQVARVSLARAQGVVTTLP